MRTYIINRKFYRGRFPAVVTVGGEQLTSNENGEIVDPPLRVAQMLEDMPEWARVQGDYPFEDGTTRAVARN